MTMLRRLLPGLTIALAAIFFGIAAYIVLAEQPARLALAPAPMLAQWKLSFAVGIAVQGTLAIVTGLAGVATWWLLRDWRFLAGGLLMLANWPWTLVMIAPINSALLATGPEAADAASHALIQRWGELHAMRAGFALVALLLFLWPSRRTQSL